MFILEIILLSYFVYVVAYAGIFSAGGLFYRPCSLPFDPPHRRFCVLIPSYKEDAVILDTARKALNQSYPHQFFDVVVIADSLHHSTVNRLKELPIRVFVVQFDKSTKVKSLNKALKQLHGYDYAVILDADNVMAYEFLESMNGLIAAKGYKAIQGQRKPKNEENSLAFLDGISEYINNHIYRKGSTALGMSASINGSGVAFDFQLLKKHLGAMTSVGGFDRELELLMLKDKARVYYHRDAVVFDEKVSQARAFQNQRRRWIASQYYYLRKYFKDGMLALLKGDFVFFNSSVLRNIQLPRLLNLGLLFLVCVASFFFRHLLVVPYLVWPVLFALNALAIAVAIPKKYYSFRLLASIFSLPVLFARMTGILFRLKGANSRFIHTPHQIKPVRDAK